MLLQTPFAAAAARARGHAARGGQPLLAERAVHIIKGAGAKQSGDGAAALARMALAHGAKVGHSNTLLKCHKKAAILWGEVLLICVRGHEVQITCHLFAPSLLHLVAAGRF